MNEPQHPEYEPVGALEIAERLSVARATVEQWRVRPHTPPFPEPRWTVGGRPAWSWPDVEEWARAAGRR
ncbi:DNA-binding protein [Aquihabitans sp. McL0605]|uniref:DNA-binding protein n=1 Tax=Aquihabitans sp. McL0605 TaxID=3415671 RepID=UPI003CF79FCF